MNMIILPCSARKRATGPHAAVDCYDGPLYQTYRAWRRTQTADTIPIQIWIVSGRYAPDGYLLDGDRLVVPYDRRLSRDQAAACAPHLLAHLSEILADARARTGVGFARSFVALGADYRLALPLEQLSAVDLAAMGTLTCARGGIGYWRQQLGRWLRTINE